jgi:hypothetical protein
LVTVLAGWMALASAAVVALSPPAAAAFAVLAVGLVAVTTLFLSMRWGAGVAVVSLVTFAVAMTAGRAPPWTLTGDDLARLARSLIRWQTLAPDLAAAAALGGTAVCAELASTSLEWDMAPRGGARRPRHMEGSVPPAPPLASERTRHDARPRRRRSRRTVRQEEA